MSSLRTACTYDCPDACGLLLVDEGGERWLKGDPDHPITRGFTCLRMHSHLARLKAPDRVRSPLVREAGGWMPVSWDTALELAAERLSAALDDEGPDEGSVLATLLAAVLAGASPADAPLTREAYLEYAARCAGPVLGAPDSELVLDDGHKLLPVPRWLTLSGNERKLRSLVRELDADARSSRRALNLATAAALSGSTWVARVLACVAARRAPDDAAPANLLGVLAREDGSKEGPGLLRYALSRAPGNPVVLTNLGFAALAAHDASQAAESFDAALRADPKHPAALFGRVLLARSDPAKYWASAPALAAVSSRRSRFALSGDSSDGVLPPLVLPAGTPPPEVPSPLPEAPAWPTLQAYLDDAPHWMAAAQQRQQQFLRDVGRASPGIAKPAAPSPPPAVRFPSHGSRGEAAIQFNRDLAVRRQPELTKQTRAAIDQAFTDLAARLRESRQAFERQPRSDEARASEVRLRSCEERNRIAAEFWKTYQPLAQQAWLEVARAAQEEIAAAVAWGSQPGSALDDAEWERIRMLAEWSVIGRWVVQSYEVRRLRSLLREGALGSWKTRVDVCEARPRGSLSIGIPGFEEEDAGAEPAQVTARLPPRPQPPPHPFATPLEIDLRHAKVWFTQAGLDAKVEDFLAHEGGRFAGRSGCGFDVWAGTNLVAAVPEGETWQAPAAAVEVDEGRVVDAWLPAGARPKALPDGLELALEYVDR